MGEQTKYAIVVKSSQEIDVWMEVNGIGKCYTMTEQDALIFADKIYAEIHKSK